MKTIHLTDSEQAILLWLLRALDQAANENEGFARFLLDGNGEGDPMSVDSNGREVREAGPRLADIGLIIDIVEEANPAPDDVPRRELEWARALAARTVGLE